MIKQKLISFEKKIVKQWENAEIPYPIHFSGGNEDELIEIFKDIKKEDYVNIDINKECKPDLLLDVGKERLPYKNNEVDYIYCDNVLEHLYENEIEFVMSEFHRVIKEEGDICLIMPYKTSSGAFYWRHKTFFGYYALRDFDIDKGPGIQVKHLPVFKFKRRLRFAGVLLGIEKVLDIFFNLPKIKYFYDNSGLCFLIPAQRIIFKLKKVKNER